MDILGENSRHTSVMGSLYFHIEACAYKEIPLNWADKILCDNGGVERTFKNIFFVRTNK